MDLLLQLKEVALATLSVPISKLISYGCIAILIFVRPCRLILL